MHSFTGLIGAIAVPDFSFDELKDLAPDLGVAMATLDTAAEASESFSTYGPGCAGTFSGWGGCCVDHASRLS